MTVSLAYEVRGVSKTHRGADRPANDGIDLRVEAGQIIGLLGPNGAGKTTLVRQLVGLSAPDAGTVELFGVDVTDRPAVLRGWVAYLAQDEPALAEMPVTVALETTGRLRGMPIADAREAANSLIEEFALTQVRDRALTKCSGGQRRLACVATSLIGDRPVLVLDEPTTGLDPIARRLVWQSLRRRRERGMTIVLVTHNVAEAETLLDRVAVLADGRVIACDTPGRLKAAVSDEVRLDVVWRADPPVDDGTVESLRCRALIEGRRWSARLPSVEAQSILMRLTASPIVEHLDDFHLATPSLEDVYVALGHAAGDLEHV